MDYAPVNLAPKGVKQGDYFTTTIGPYDYWAIEYAYKPLSGGVEGEYDDLKKIASKCAGAGLDYATDEDMYSSADPLTNAWDLGADPCQFGKDRNRNAPPAATRAAVRRRNPQSLARDRRPPARYRLGRSARAPRAPIATWSPARPSGPWGIRRRRARPASP